MRICQQHTLAAARTSYEGSQWGPYSAASQERALTFWCVLKISQLQLEESAKQERAVKVCIALGRGVLQYSF
jgi:hypothetical protein